ncbi:MAG: FAD-dependent oxidoreductase [Zavarzinella sp.]
MSIRLTNLRLPIEHEPEELPDAVQEILGTPGDEPLNWRILRKSLDLRDKSQLRFVYTVAVDLPPEEESLALHIAQRQHTVPVDHFAEEAFSLPHPGVVPLQHRPVVIGSGPGGLFAAYFLAQAGYRPIVLERGTPVNERIRDVKRFDEGGDFAPESNYLFGEGGAGTFSDGKLTCRGSGTDYRKVLEVFAECKGQQPGRPSILYYHRPHLGSNRLPAVVKALRQRIESYGGQVVFHRKMTDLIIAGDQLTHVVTEQETFAADLAILATGHSARDVYEMLQHRGVAMEPKPFQMGVRVEHPQDDVNWVQYGNMQHVDILGNADYSLVAHGKQADVFTFCMCAGGYIIPSVSQEEYFCTNGMSLSKRDSPFANSGLVVTIPTSQFSGNDLLGGVRLQEQYERLAFEMGRGEYTCPFQRADDFLHDRISSESVEISYPRGKVAVKLRELLPPLVVQTLMDGLPRMNRMWRGHFLKNAVLVGPESRGSSPIRIVRNQETRESPTQGLYPVGEGAGYAGGIVSAAVDGLRTAKAIIARYAPPR